MAKAARAIPVLQIFLDKAIYPRGGVNPRLTSAEIGKAVGRSRGRIDEYAADLRATFQLDVDLKILRMNRLGIPQERIAKRLGVIQRVVSVPHFWNIDDSKWPVQGKTKPDLIIFDPPISRGNQANMIRPPYPGCPGKTIWDFWKVSLCLPIETPRRAHDWPWPIPIGEIPIIRLQRMRRGETQYWSMINSASSTRAAGSIPISSRRRFHPNAFSPM